MKTVNILGTKYKIIERSVNDDPKLEMCNGYCDSTVKEIIVCDMMHIEDDVNRVSDVQAYRKHTLRHEIVHAFLEESGLSGNTYYEGNWAYNEEMVDWFAYQLPKILEACSNADCI